MSLPVGYDHATAEASYASHFFNLAPSGRELDYELAYGVRALGGYLDLNAYLRTDPGHVRAAGKDLGGALRFTIRP